MSAFGSSSTNLGSPGSDPRASWRYVMRRAVQQSGWNRWREPNRPDDDQRPPQPNEPQQGWKPWAILIAAVVVLALPISWGVIEYLNAPGALRRVTKHEPAGKSLLGFTDTPKLKPDPGKPIVPPAQQQQFTNPTSWKPGPPPESPWVAETPPQILVPPPTPGQPQIQPQISNGTVTPPASQMPPANTTPGRPPQPAAPAQRSAFAVTYPARHDKLFGDSCVGQLTLNAGGLSFSCPGDSSSAIQVPLNQIGAVDDNGVLLTSGKKYHFSIRGMSKDAEVQLFANWLHHVR